MFLLKNLARKGQEEASSGKQHHRFKHSYNPDSFMEQDVGLIKPICSVWLFSKFFIIIKTVAIYLLNNIPLVIFNRCPRSWGAGTAGTPVKYGCDLKNLQCKFVMS